MNYAGEPAHSHQSRRGLIILDRDGVLNKLVIDADHGTIDSPLHPEQVSLFPGVATALRRLNESGYELCIASNQPAAAKGKVRLDLLQATHQRVVDLCQQEGARILESFICWHRHEDACSCRKPQPGLLQAALSRYGQDLPSSSCWMVGDGVTDMQAGKSVSVNLAFINKRRCDSCRIVSDYSLTPRFWGETFCEFATTLIGVTP